MLIIDILHGVVRLSRGYPFHNVGKLACWKVNNVGHATMLSVIGDMNSATRMISYLGRNDRPRANCFNGGPITSDGSGGFGCGNGKGKYKKVPGLVFDVDYPHFDPSRWKCPISKDVTHVNLELCVEGYDGVEIVTSYALHVHRHKNRDTSMLLSTCENIAANYSSVRNMGWGGVGGMFSAGYNVGFKGRVSRVALSSKMKRKPCSIVHSMTNCLSIAGGIFQEEFGDENVGYDEMMRTQANMWPKHRKKLSAPASWIVSRDLGNPEHVDKDFSRSYAGWFTHHDIDNESAWFLFPEWGVAIELSNDTWISWDGVNCRHCSSVPHLRENNHIYSLFTAITSKVYSTLDRVNTCESLLQKRVHFNSLQVDQMVSLRWVPPLDKGRGKLSRKGKRRYGHTFRRWLHCVVVHINHSNGTVKLCERNRNQRKLPLFTKSDIHNSVVHGWV